MTLITRRLAGAAWEPLPAAQGNAIRQVGPLYPIAVAWNVGDLWADTSNEASSIVLRRWTGSGFLPAPTVLHVDHFTGTDGSLLGGTWTTGRNPSAGTGGGATVQSNALRLQTSNIGGYAGTGRISRRSNITAPTNVVVGCALRYDETECYPAIFARAENAIDTQTGYALHFGKSDDTVWVAKYQSFSGSNLTPADIPFSFEDGVNYGARFYVNGSAIKARVWPATEPEPSTWLWEGTDTSITAAGAVGLTNVPGAASVPSNAFIDNWVVQTAA